tara:strand:- start:87 stop:2354 length:2268 start_codon:yes stop_codon:yes gene_type:complete
MRFEQFKIWSKNPEFFFVGESPLMTTLDAPYWLRISKEYNEGVFGKKKRLRNYPDNSGSYIQKQTNEVSILPKNKKEEKSISRDFSSNNNKKIRYRDVPLLSYIIAKISPFFDYNYYLTGTLLIPILASLFIIPLGIYFFLIGIPIAGILGGLIGTFSMGYYARSSIGRIDTDLLNLFFPILTSLLILITAKLKTDRSVLLLSMMTGYSLFLFHWWYGKAGFILVYFIVLILFLFFHKIRLRTIFLSSFLFILCVNPGIFLEGANSLKGFFSGYFSIESQLESTTHKNQSVAIFPNTMTTISEVDKLPTSLVLQRVITNTFFGWVGLISLLVLSLLRWRNLLPLIPLLIIGLLSFKSSNRFIMYLGPFIGIGLGWLIQIMIESIMNLRGKNNLIKFKKEKSNKKQNNNTNEEKKLWTKMISYLQLEQKDLNPSNSLNTKYNISQSRKVREKSDHQEPNKKHFFRFDINWFFWIKQGTIYLVTGIFFFSISSQTAISFVPRPSIHPKIYATFFELKKKIPLNSALLSWWDYGYAITDATDLATFHDGGSQKSPKTYFTARGLVSKEQEELYDIAQYLSTEGNQDIYTKINTPEKLLNAVRNPQKKPIDPIYLFFTADMTAKYGSISKIGSWDIFKGGSFPRQYQNLFCNKITLVLIECRGVKIDLKSGKINNQLNLRRMLFISKGQVIKEQEFGHPQGYTLQLIIVGKKIVEVQLIDENIFLSNYNQMFFLGRYDENLFEETYNALPFSRLYRFKF